MQEYVSVIKTQAITPADANWYLKIATRGYGNDGSTVYFPAYPLLIRVLKPIVGISMLAAVLISNFALIGALVLLYYLTVEISDAISARRAVVYILLFPTAFFMMAVYTESLFLLFTLGSLLSAIRSRWLLAAILGALAALTRLQGVLIIVPLAYMLWRRMPATIKNTNPGTKTSPVIVDYVLRSIPLFITPLATIVFLAYTNLSLLNAYRGELHAEFVLPWGNVLASISLFGLEQTTSIGRVLIHPTNSNIVYLAAVGSYFSPNEERGVYKSTDAGSTWDKSLFISDSTGAIDIIMDPTNPDRMLAAMWERVRRPNASHLYGPSSGIYKTSDGGTIWELIPSSTGLPNPMTQNVGRIGLAISQSNPEIVYTLFNDGVSIISLFKSTDFGNNWIDVDPDNELQDGASTFSWYFGQVRVHPTNPDVSRILYTMGREGVLPRGLVGRLDARFGTPVPAILLVSALSLLAVWLSLDLLASMISFGALVAFSVVNLAVIKHYLIDRDLESGWLRHGVLPAIGCVLTGWLWTSLSRQSLMVGLEWLAAGTIYVAVITRGFRRALP